MKFIHILQDIFACAALFLAVIILLMMAGLLYEPGAGIADTPTETNQGE